MIPDFWHLRAAKDFYSKIPEAFFKSQIYFENPQITLESIVYKAYPNQILIRFYTPITTILN